MTAPALRVIPGDGPRDRGEELIDLFLRRASDNTHIASRIDLADFATFTGKGDAPAAVRLLLERGRGEANGLAAAYKIDLEGRLAPASVNRRLSTLRSLVRLARTLDIVDFTLEVKGVRTRVLRDTRGPGLTNIRRLFRYVEARTDAKGIRDSALLHLCFDLALRRSEVTSLDLADVDLGEGTIEVVGKGHREPARLTLPDPTREALDRWIRMRGPEPGPLFFGSRGKQMLSSRLSSSGLARIVREAGRAAGVQKPVRPHGLRHAAITEALEASGGDVRAVQKFSRHASVETLLVYDDARQDLGGKVAAKLAKGMHGE